MSKFDEILQVGFLFYLESSNFNSRRDTKAGRQTDQTSYGSVPFMRRGGGATSYYADPRAYTMKIINTLSIVVELVFVL